MKRVYMAGPIDYADRRPGEHTREDWRHRYFIDHEFTNHIEILCPICMNVASEGWEQVMSTNAHAMLNADLFVGYFPGDVASFGTPVEVYEWAVSAFQTNKHPGVLVHPSKPGVFVAFLQAKHGLVVVRDFMEARQWLSHMV